MIDNENVQPVEAPKPPTLEEVRNDLLAAVAEGNQPSKVLSGVDFLYDAALAGKRFAQVLDDTNLHLKACRNLIAEVNIDSSEEQLRECIVAIADELGERSPFIEDISEVQERAEEIYGKLDDISYAVSEFQRRLDDVLGDMYEYTEGRGETDDSYESFEERLDEICNDWSQLYDLTENWY